MDPNATLQLLINALEEADMDTAREAARNLAEWVRGGGYMPSIDPPVFDFLLTVMADLLPRGSRRPSSRK
jgi:predicted ATPase